MPLHDTPALPGATTARRSAPGAHLALALALVALTPACLTPSYLFDRPALRQRPESVGLTVRGQVMAVGYAPRPVSFALVRLRKGQELLASTTTDGSGRFTFHQPLEAGRYQLVLDSDWYQGEAAFTYEHGEVEVSVSARSRAP